MDKLIEEFEKIKDSKDANEINEFLIELGKNPKKESLFMLDFFLKKSDPETFSHIKLNLIFTLGEIGKIQGLDDIYINFLMEEYQSSDRWVRNEIINALNKITNHIKLPVKILDIIKYAIIDEYLPVALSGMKTITYYENIPDELFKYIFKALHTSDSKLNDQISIVLNKFIKDESHLFNLLNNSQTYKIFNKKAFRSLLLAFFNSAISLSNLESFRELIESSKWEFNYKEMCLKEIDTYQKLLLRSI